MPLAPAGSFPAGSGPLATLASPLLATLPDSITNLPAPCRWLNLATGDYAYTADGRIVGMQAVQQLVELALATVFGSAADFGLGQRYANIREQGQNITQQLTDEASRALSRLTSASLIRIEQVYLQATPSNPDAQKVFVRWRDLHTGQVTTWPPTGP